MKTWIALVACMLIPAVGNAIFVSCFPLWVVPWIDEFHVPRSAAMTGFGIGNLVMALASPIVGRALERFPARNCMALGGIAMALGYLLASFAVSFWQIIVLYSTVLALGAAFIGMLPAQSVAVRILPEKAGTVGGLITLGISAGGIFVPALLTSVLAAIGWRKAFWVAGGLSFFIIVPVAWFLLMSYGARPVAPHGHGAGARSATKLTTRALLGSLAFWVPLMGILPVLFVVGTVLTNAVAIAADSGIDVHVAGYLVPVIAAGGAVGSIGLGWLADRFDYRMLFATMAVAVIIALLTLLEHLTAVPMACTFFVVGFASGGVFPLLGVIIVRTFGSLAFARIMGLMMPMLVMSMAVSPVIAGAIRDRTGSYSGAFIYCAALMVMSMVAVLTFKTSPASPTPSVPHEGETTA